MFLQRLLVTLVLAPFGLVVIYLGGWYYFVPASIIILIGVFEYVDLVTRLGWKVSWLLLLPAILLLLLNSQFWDSQWESLILFVSLFAGMCYALWLYEKKEDESAVGVWLISWAGIMLLGWLASHFFRIRQLPENGWQWTMFPMVVIWTADSMAYLVGKRLGRHKLSPRLSPNKTIEGFVGSIVGGMIAGWVFAGIIPLPFLHVTILSLLICLFAPLGDLAISLLKRCAGKKDSGKILPGHGGSLDRTDSLVWAVAIAYYYVLYLV